MVSSSFFFFTLVSIILSNASAQRVAIAHLVSENITGSITFSETNNGTRVSGTIVGLPPGYYGFHVHELGDIRTCDSTGAHFNPETTNHGGREHTVRHVGDFGNVLFVTVTNNTAYSQVDFLDNMITLVGRNSILGRALVLHEQEDDLGLGGHETSLTTGNAGARVACGVIGIMSPADPWFSSAISIVPSFLLFTLAAALFMLT